MKKIVLFLASMAVTSFSIISCGKTNADSDFSYFSDAEKAALKVLNGTFTYTLSVGDWSNTTTITFLEQYNPPKTGTLDNGGTTRVHGKYRIVYDRGQTYEYYYNLSNDADRVYSYFSLTGINSINKKDFRVVDDNTVQVKEVKDVLWDTYRRK